MKRFYLPRGKGLAMLLAISLLSILSISATFVLAGETIFLPLIVQQNPTATPTTPPAATATPEGTPEPTNTINLIVNPANPDKAWALAYFVKSYNAAGRPVMQIYPSETAPEFERIKIPEGEIVEAIDTPVIADGGGKFWQLVDYKGRDGETLYLRAEDVTKVTASAP